MCQILFESNIVSGPKENGDKLVISMSIVGISWAKGVTPPKNWTELEKYLPWNWGKEENLNEIEVPNQVQLIVGDIVEQVGSRIGPSFDPDDLEKYIIHINEILKRKLCKSDGDLILKEDLVFEIASRGSDEIEITEEGTNPESEATGLLFSQILELSQEITPLNELLNLVYFFEIKVPDKASFDAMKSFSFFPFSDTTENIWNQGQNIIDHGDRLKTREYGNEESALMAFSSIEKVEKSKKGGRIRFRNEIGDFLGEVEGINVQNGDDWTEGINSRISTFYDLPKLMLDYLRKKTESITKDTIGAYDSFLWGSFRDSLGFGLKGANSNGNLLTWEIWYQITQEEDKYEESYKDFLKRLKESNKKYKNVNAWLTELENAANKSPDSVDITSKIHGIKELSRSTAVDSEKIHAWLSLWDQMLRIFESPEFQKLIILVQWEGFTCERTSVKTEKEIFRVESFVNSILSEKSWSIRNINKDALVKDFVIQSNANDSITSAKKDIIDRYFSNRVEVDQDEFYPVIDFSTINFEDIKLEFRDLLDQPLKEELKEIFSKADKAYDIPPPVRLEVASYEADDEKSQDVNDEISGYILLMRRNIDGRQNEDWRYLNWANPVILDPPVFFDPEKQKDESKSSFEKDYLFPAFIPNSDGYKKPYLTISNESLSLIAGHDTFQDSDYNQDEKNEDFGKYLSFAFPNGGDKMGYAFWYGFKYQFAAYVALNSGVLPPVLRKKGNVLNLPNPEPKIPEENIFPEKEEGEKEGFYTHLRKVPVSKPRVSVSNLLASETNGFNPPITPPKDFLPLTYELPQWRKRNSGKDNPKAEPEQSFFLLADSDGFKQNEIVFEIKKPTTDFWNWYAWLGPEAKEYQQEALKQELESRDKRSGVDIDDSEIANQKNGVNALCDPAVANSILVEVITIFPTYQENAKVWHFPTTTKSSPLEDLSISLATKIGETEIVVPKEAGTIQIPEGYVVKIKISSLIISSFFEETGGKFPSYMGKNLENFGQDGNDYKKSPSVELFIETAQSKIEEAEIDLYKNLEIINQGDKVEAKLKVPKEKIKEFAYLSRLDIRHQIWSWNGRLENSKVLLQNIDKLNPEEGKTTCAMKWEAWAFSDRPDSASYSWKEFLIASIKDREKGNTGSELQQPDNYKPQVVFTDSRPGEEKALYYRFALTAHSRYSPLGGIYENSVEAKVAVDENFETPWKRYLRKSTLTKSLPKPSLRFAIPLTDSIEQSSDSIYPASILLVLNDRWFTEAGLAEQLEVGIDVVKDPGTGKGRGGEYLMAGNDPILTGSSLKPIETNEEVVQSNNTPDEGDKKLRLEVTGENKVAVFEPSGPAGLTFEPKMQTPLLRGSSFILDVPDVSLFLEAGVKEGDNILHPWAMMQIALRRNLREKLYEGDVSTESLRSEWTPKQWVQFLPSANSLIPREWRRQQQVYGYVKAEIKNEDKTDGKLTIEFKNSEMPLFDFYGDRDKGPKVFERYLILTNKIFDIGGQPTEEYIATFKYQTEKNNPLEFVLNHPKSLDQKKLKDGYFRLMSVRIRPDNDNGNKPEKDIWEKLFGKNTEDIQINKIQEDPEAALPMVSKRLEIKFNL